MRRANHWIYLALLPLLSTGTEVMAQRRVSRVAGDSLRTGALAEVVVTTEVRTDVLGRSPVALDRREIEESYETSLLPLLNERVPGFFATSRGIMGYGVSGGAAGTMNIRGIGGAPTSGVLVTVDGRPQYMGLMGHPVADVYRTASAEAVGIVRGPMSALYGSGAMGGVVNIVTRNDRRDGIHTRLHAGYGSYNTLQSELSNSVWRGRFSSTVTGSYNRSDGHRPDMEFEQYGGSGRVAYDFTPHWAISADVDIMQFTASNPGTTAVPLTDNDSRITRSMASVALDHTYEKTSGTLRLYGNWGRHKINDGYGVGELPKTYRFNSKDRLWGLTLDQCVLLFAGNTLRMGFAYTHFGGETWRKLLAGGTRPMVDAKEYELAGYVGMEQALGKRLLLTAAVRADHHSRTGLEWIPQGAVVVKLPHRASLEASVSKGFRNPTLRELYMFSPVNNPDLRPERITHCELAYRQDALAHDRLHYEASLFGLKGDNLIQTRPVSGHQQYFNVGEVENWGAEAQIRYDVNRRWRVAANYSWLRMRHPVLAAPEHKFYAEARCAYGRWLLHTGLQYVDGLYTSLAPERTEDFWLWDLSATWRVCRETSVYVKGENLLAQRYEINAGYPMPKATVMCGVNLIF